MAETAPNSARRKRQLQAMKDREDSQAVLMKDVRRLKRYGEVSPAMASYCRDAEAESGALIRGLGGHSALSVQELILVSDLALLRALQNASFGAWLSGDPEAADAIPGLVSSRRQTLLALGLGKRRAEKSLETFVDEVTQ